MHRVARWVGRAAVIALVLGSAGCGGQAGRGAKIATSFGHMAGYVWSGQLSSVAAAWAVPRMAPGSGAAHASTWIGAQARGALHRSPFIQVGIVEDRAPSAKAIYGAFWTDTKRGFHPQILFRVRPGDVVATALVLASGRWQVSIKDTTSGRRASFSTDEEGEGSFSLAEWLQEDPIGGSGRVTPYPRLSSVRMSALAVNGAAPPYSEMYAQWMSLPAGDLAPTAVHEDAFVIVPARVSPAGRRYLAIAAPRNIAARRFALAVASWTSGTPPREIMRASAAAAGSERMYGDRLARGPWPAAALAPIDDLVHGIRTETALLVSAGRHAPASPAAWRARLEAVGVSLQGVVHRVRRALHLPEIVSGEAPRSASPRPR